MFRVIIPLILKKPKLEKSSMNQKSSIRYIHVKSHIRGQAIQQENEDNFDLFVFMSIH